MVSNNLVDDIELVDVDKQGARLRSDSLIITPNNKATKTLGGAKFDMNQEFDESIMGRVREEPGTDTITTEEK